jgi:hypothetical protein
MAIVVNSFWLDRLWDPVSSETYEDDPSLSALDTADETAVRWLARTYLAPGVARLDPTQHQCLKETLRYGLNAFSDRQLTSTLERCLPPFRVHRHVRLQVPPNIRWFYEVIWQELFGPEDWHVQDLTTYVVDRRLSSPLPSEAIIVNPSWLDRLWSPIGGGADVDDHPLEDLNAADETAVRRLAREYLATGFARYTPTQQRCLKETFRYGLNALSTDADVRYLDLLQNAQDPNIRQAAQLVEQANLNGAPYDGIIFGGGPNPTWGKLDSPFAYFRNEFVKFPH